MRNYKYEKSIWLSSKSDFPSLEKSNFHSCKKIQFEEKLQVKKINLAKWIHTANAGSK